MRLMQAFFEALGRVASSRATKGYEVVEQEVQTTFRTFFERDIQHFDALTPPEIIAGFTADPYPTEKVEMVAMLLFELGMATPDSELLRQRLTKANALIDHISEMRHTVSFDHLGKQHQILLRLNSI